MLVQSPPPAPPHSSDSPTISPTGVATAQSPSTHLQVTTGKALSLSPSQVSNQPKKIISMLFYLNSFMFFYFSLSAYVSVDVFGYFMTILTGIS
jgi:hypothetical protein